MAEEKKSFYRRAVDYLQAPPERQVKGYTYNQSTNSALDSAVFGTIQHLVHFQVN